MIKHFGKNELVVCDYVDDRVTAYLEEHHSADVLTLFKEPFPEYRGNTITFVDDILEDADYKNIDIFVKNAIAIIGEALNSHLNLDGYNLFQYFEIRTKRNLTKIYKYKYAVDKFVKQQKGTEKLLAITSNQALLEWLDHDYLGSFSKPFEYDQERVGIQSRIKTWIKSSSLIQRAIPHLVPHSQSKSGRILWMGRYHSKLFYDLERKGLEIWCLPSAFGLYLRLVGKGLKPRLLSPKDHSLIAERWNYLKERYGQGLEKIASVTGLEKSLLEAALNIGSQQLYDLLLTLTCLRDNRQLLELLVVNISVEGPQGLAVDYFNRHGLPSLELIHGVPAVVEVGKTTRIAVYGQRDKEFLIDSGVDGTKIIITGSPSYDKYFLIKDSQKSSEFLLLILDWISYFSSTRSHKEIYEQVMNMIEMMKILSQERLIIKLHPLQTDQELRYVQHLVNTAKVHKLVKAQKDVDLTDLLKKAKIVFTHSSSVGVEALLMKKTLIVLDFFPGRTVGYEKYGGCLVARDFKELLAATKEILNNIAKYQSDNAERLEKTRSYFSASLNGESYKAVAALCKEMVESTR